MRRAARAQITRVCSLSSRHTNVPYDKYSSLDCSDELQRAPPALHPRSIHDQYTLANRQRAVIPHQQEMQHRINRTVAGDVDSDFGVNEVES